MSKNLTYGILTGNIMETPAGLDEDNLNFVQLKSFLGAYFENVASEGCEILTNCDFGLQLVAAQAICARNLGRFLTCVIPFEEQPVKWYEHYRNIYFNVHKKCRRTVNLGFRPGSAGISDSEYYIANNADVITLIKSKDEAVPTAAVHAFKKGKKIEVIECESLEVKLLKPQLPTKNQ